MTPDRNTDIANTMRNWQKNRKRIHCLNRTDHRKDRQPVD